MRGNFKAFSADPLQLDRVLIDEAFNRAGEAAAMDDHTVLRTTVEAGVFQVLDCRLSGAAWCDLKVDLVRRPQARATQVTCLLQAQAQLRASGWRKAHLHAASGLTVAIQGFNGRCIQRLLTIAQVEQAQAASGTQGLKGDRFIKGQLQRLFTGRHDAALFHASIQHQGARQLQQGQARSAGTGYQAVVEQIQCFDALGVTGRDHTRLQRLAQIDHHHTAVSGNKQQAAGQAQAHTTTWVGLQLAIKAEHNTFVRLVAVDDFHTTAADSGDQVTAVADDVLRVSHKVVAAGLCRIEQVQGTDFPGLAIYRHAQGLIPARAVNPRRAADQTAAVQPAIVELQQRAALQPSRAGHANRVFAILVVEGKQATSRCYVDFKGARVGVWRVSRYRYFRSKQTRALLDQAADRRLQIFLMNRLQAVLFVQVQPCHAAEAAGHVQAFTPGVLFPLNGRADAQGVKADLEVLGSLAVENFLFFFGRLYRVSAFHALVDSIGLRFQTQARVVAWQRRRTADQHWLARILHRERRRAVQLRQPATSGQGLPAITVDHIAAVGDGHAGLLVDPHIAREDQRGVQFRLFAQAVAETADAGKAGLVAITVFTQHIDFARRTAW